MQKSMITMAIFVLLLNSAGNPPNNAIPNDRTARHRRLLMIDPKGRIWQSRDGVTWKKMDPKKKKDGVVFSIEGMEYVQNIEDSEF